MPSEKRGFTLIELLVVVAIIALLISILLPSLSRAREQAKGTVCMSNLKQIGMGFFFYGQDFGEQPPPNRMQAAPGAPNGGTPPEFRDSDWWYYAHMVPRYIPGNRNSGTNAAFSGVFGCPSEPIAGRAYAMNIFASNYESSKQGAQTYTRGKPFNPFRVKDAPALMLIAEAHAIYADGANPNLFGTRHVIGMDGASIYRKWAKVEELFNRGPFYGYVDFEKHKGKANFLFSDLHVEPFARQAILIKDSQDPSKMVSSLKVKWSPEDPQWNTPTAP